MKGKVAITLRQPAAGPGSGTVQQAVHLAVSDPPELLRDAGAREYVSRLAAHTMHAMAADLYNPAVRCVTLVVELDLPETTA